MKRITGLQGIKIGRLFGIDLKLHFSLIFLFFYIAIVSAMQFPAVIYQAGLAQSDLYVGPWISGFIFALGLLVSIVIHEYSHVAMAKALGVKVRGVTLMMLGGISEMGSIPEQPYAELKLAVVGPFASFILWLVLGGISRVVPQPEIVLFSYWLANTNLVLAIFNLLPAFPLDGGRALRSILVAKQGKIQGSENAIKLSRILAWGLGILGFLQFNFILIFIAFFIYTAAQSEWALLVSQDILKGYRVSDVMHEVKPVFESMALDEVASQMIKTRIRVLPVIAASGEVGLVDLEALREVEQGRWKSTTVKEVMVPTDHILQKESLLSEVIEDLARSPFQALPVKNHQDILGVLIQSDLIDLLRFKALEEPLGSGKKAA